MFSAFVDGDSDNVFRVAFCQSNVDAPVVDGNSCAELHYEFVWCGLVQCCFVCFCFFVAGVHEFVGEIAVIRKYE